MRTSPYGVRVLPAPRSTRFPYTTLVRSEVDPASTPKGLGSLTRAVAQREVCDWNRFANKGQVSRYCRLTPSLHNSGATCRQVAIDKHGNPRLRTLAVEAAWRMLVFQPDY